MNNSLIIVSLLNWWNLIKFFFFMSKLFSTLSKGCISHWKGIIGWFDCTIGELLTEERVFSWLFCTFIFDVHIWVFNTFLIVLVWSMHWWKLAVIHYWIWWIALVEIMVKFVLEGTVKGFNNANHIRSFFTKRLERVNLQSFFYEFYLLLFALIVVADFFQFLIKFFQLWLVLWINCLNFFWGMSVVDWSIF